MNTNAKNTHHMGILCFSSTGSQYDHPGTGHSNNQRHEDHVQEYQQVVL